MSDDICIVLRNPSLCVYDTGKPCLIESDSILQQAADEIERLRAAVAAERDACAATVLSFKGKSLFAPSGIDAKVTLLDVIAAAIKARGTE